MHNILDDEDLDWGSRGKKRGGGGGVTFVRFFSPSFSTKEENDVLSWREREKGERRGGGGRPSRQRRKKTRTLWGRFHEIQFEDRRY